MEGARARLVEWVAAVGHWRLLVRDPGRHNSRGQAVFPVVRGRVSFRCGHRVGIH